MNAFCNARRMLLAVALCCALAPVRSMAEDIDIFLGSSGGSASSPNVMIMLDNSVNDLFAAKIDAIIAVLATITAAEPVDVGLAMWSPGGGTNPATAPKGAYIRFAPRSMADPTIRTALTNILTLIKTRGDFKEGLKNEPELYYEIFKFYSGLAAFAGVATTKNPNVDSNGNNGGTTPLAPYLAADKRTAFSQGLTTGFAFKADGTYNGSNVASPCSKNYIIYIAANNNFQVQDIFGQQVYEGRSAGPALPGTSTFSATVWADEWAGYLYKNTNPQIVTYVIDAASVGNADAQYTKLLQDQAKQGGGTWQFASSQAQIFTALLKIFAEIKAVNSTFASASLPVNTTNRAQDKNQVFIPMFRPDPVAKPLWMGNLKQYQLISSGGSIVLGDNSSPPIAAVNPVSGFVTDCATSFWTTDSGTYWQSVPENPSPAGTCPTTPFNKFSDAPDGPIVEKGGVAEVIRKGNNPPTTNNTPTFAVNRTVYTHPLAGGALTAFNTASSGRPAAEVNFILGQDVNDENANANTTETRPSLHGDAVHSRPLPVDYGGATGVTVYYGANDGMLRAIDAATGRERWAFVAPEHFSKLQRLKDNSPLISYPNVPASTVPTPLAKDYFFDGSFGLYQNADNTNVWIYATMRRGGRMIYAFNVTNPALPAFKWKAGCPNLANDTGCTTAGLTGIGQTWSTPAAAATIQGYGSGPVVIVGGGYDGCEDANTLTPSCSTPKGAGVYVFDANNGTLIKSFSTTRSVAADVALLASATAGLVDHAYAVDTGGNIYRIDFGNPGDTGTSNWAIHRVAYTNGSSRKFFYAPALLLAPGGKVYVTVGSGDREHPLQTQYPYTAPVTNRFYVYLDDLATAVAAPANNLDDTAIMNDVTLCADATCQAANTVLPTSTKKGWFMNLNQNGTGEQAVTSAVIAAGLVAFSTNRPIPPAAGTCSTTLGEARGYFVNLFNGSGAIGVLGSSGGDRSAVFVGGGLPPSPVISTVMVGTAPVTVVIGAVQRTGGASSPIGAQQVKPIITMNRKSIYWKSSGED